MMGMKHLESLGMADSVRLCSSWVLHQQQSRLGTTFPPLATHLACAHIVVASQEAPSSRCLSEPNLAKYSEFGDPIILGEEGEEEDYINCGQKEDEDHLFEFDLDSHGSSDNGDEDEGESIFGGQQQDNVEEEAFPVQATMKRRGSCSSISTSTSTTSNISGREKAGNTIDIFGSKSSGLGSERRSSTLSGENLEEEGGSSKSIPSPQLDSPLPSPDSCLEEDSLLEEPDLCIQCATRAVVEAEEKLKEARIAAESIVDLIIENIHITSNVSENSETDNTTEDQSIEVSSKLRISSAKLESLLGSLEQDKHYPSSLSSSPQISSPLCPKPLRLPGRVSIASSSPSRQADKSSSRLRKTSSLKSGANARQTTGRNVRFADILGLELNMVKVFTDEIPRVPISAFTDLDLDPREYQVSAPMPVRKIAISEPPAPQVPTMPTTSLMPMFTQPSSNSSTFNNRLGRQKICLDSALADGQESVTGTIRVVNLSFHKTVIVKWTTNDWASSAETTATYVKGSSKDGTDQFRFKLELGSLQVGSRLQFCLKYICEGEHWDSNGGANYAFQVFPCSQPTSSHTISAPLEIRSRGWGSSSQAAPSGSSLWGPTRVSQSGGNLWAPSPSGRQWGVSPSHHGDDPWLRFM